MNTRAAGAKVRLREVDQAVLRAHRRHIKVEPDEVSCGNVVGNHSGGPREERIAVPRDQSRQRK